MQDGIAHSLFIGEDTRSAKERRLIWVKDLVEKLEFAQLSAPDSELIADVVSKCKMEGASLNDDLSVVFTREQQDGSAEIQYQITFTGHSGAFRMKPVVGAPYDGTIRGELDPSTRDNRILFRVRGNNAEAIASEVKATVQRIREILERINNDVSAFNSEIEGTAKECLVIADNYFDLCGQLLLTC